MPKPPMYKTGSDGEPIITPKTSKDTTFALKRQYLDRMIPLPPPTPDQVGFTKEEHDKLTW